MSNDRAKTTISLLEKVTTQRYRRRVEWCFSRAPSAMEQTAAVVVNCKNKVKAALTNKAGQDCGMPLTFRL